MNFFNGVGFRLPARKDPASFLQEVTSVKDQQVCCYGCISTSVDRHRFSDLMVFMRSMHWESVSVPCLA